MRPPSAQAGGRRVAAAATEPLSNSASGASRHLPDDRGVASAARSSGSVRPACGARSGRGRRVPRKEHVTLRRLTLGSRKYFSFLVAVGLLVATVAGFGVSNLT